MTVAVSLAIKEPGEETRTLHGLQNASGVSAQTLGTFCPFGALRRSRALTCRLAFL